MSTQEIQTPYSGADGGRHVTTEFIAETNLPLSVFIWDALGMISVAAISELGENVEQT